MGLFSWLDTKVKIDNHRIWLTRAAKSPGIRNEVAQALAGQNAIIVVGHFNDCLEQLRAAVAGLDQDRVLVARADALAGRTPTELVTDESRSVLLVVGEQHPLASHDEAIISFARSLPCRCRIVYHLSFEDPLMKRIAGDWVERLLRGLGLKEDVPIESRMVSRRIKEEMRKIARKATGDVAAETAWEWLERNCPTK